MTSARKSYTFQNLLKNITLLPSKKFGNINLYQQTVLLKIVYDLGLKFLYGQIEIFDFKKTPFRYVFSIAINVFLWYKNKVEFSGRDQEKIIWNF